MFPPSPPALSTPPFFTISTPPQQQQMSCESNAFGAERTQHAVLKINACVCVCFITDVLCVQMYAGSEV